MNTRRAFCKTAAAAMAGGVMGWNTRARAAQGMAIVLRDAKIIRVRDREGGGTEWYLEIVDDSARKGYAGPLLKEQVAAFPANFRELLAGRNAADPEKLDFATLWSACHPGKALESYANGKDPLSGAAVWGIKRNSRQTETGWAITALSAIDLALWDLRGKAAGQPVWRLLGAKRRRLSAYASMLGHSVKPAEARKAARACFDQGFKQQKWFFMNGPADGAGGLKQNIELARAVREELGAEATLMFDGIQYVWKSADLDYAIPLAKGILPYQPHSL
jgi:L-alanine-DL-glutamate epimerase-like enolase superfamily enzyme